MPRPTGRVAFHSGGVASVARSRLVRVTVRVTVTVRVRVRVRVRVEPLPANIGRDEGGHDDNRPEHHEG